MWSLALAWHRAEQAARQTPGGPQTIDKCVYITPVPTENDGQAARCGAGVREWDGVELVCQCLMSNVQCKKCPPFAFMIHGLAHAQPKPYPCHACTPQRRQAEGCFFAASGRLGSGAGWDA